ncbi:hypothetical protein Bbelb_210310 [Branchiostoma belcheri]|nr:hypothetical protein Bbelb_210310 [Branchiostoma belcheri]
MPGRLAPKCKKPTPCDSCLGFTDPSNYKKCRPEKDSEDWGKQGIYAIMEGGSILYVGRGKIGERLEKHFKGTDSDIVSVMPRRDDFADVGLCGERGFHRTAYFKCISTKSAKEAILAALLWHGGRDVADVTECRLVETSHKSPGRPDVVPTLSSTKASVSKT